MTKPRRNDLCPCGSGKKYKRCHGSAAASSESPVPTDMLRATEEFSVAAETVVDRFAESGDVRPTPTTIYHYTNDNGLRGILESGKIWMTDIFNLNDPTELRHGVTSASGVLKEAEDKTKPEIRTFIQQMSSILEEDIERMANFFVCCFSLDGDDLGQWRAYADNGKGYALGFGGHALEQAFAAGYPMSTSVMTTFQVTYDDAKIRDLQKKIITKAIPLISAPRGRGLSEETLQEYMRGLGI